MNALGSKGALVDGIERLSAESGGLLSVFVVKIEDLPNIVLDAMQGDTVSLMLLQAVQQAIHRIETAPRRAPSLCVSCPRELRKGRFSFGLIMPECDNPASAMALAVCRHCATDFDGIKAKAIEGMRRIWPDLRPVSVTHEAGGRA